MFNQYKFDPDDYFTNVYQLNKLLTTFNNYSRQQKDEFAKDVEECQEFYLGILSRTCPNIYKYLLFIFFFMKETTEIINLKVPIIESLLVILEGNDSHVSDDKKLAPHILKYAWKVLKLITKLYKPEILENIFICLKAFFPLKNEPMKRFFMKIIKPIGNTHDFDKQDQEYLITILSTSDKLSQKSQFDILNCFDVLLNDSKYFSSDYPQIAMFIIKIAFSAKRNKLRQLSIDVLAKVTSSQETQQFLLSSNVNNLLIKNLFLLPNCNKAHLLNSFKTNASYLMGLIEAIISESKSFKADLPNFINLILQNFDNAGSIQLRIDFILRHFTDIPENEIEPALDLFDRALEQKIVSSDLILNQVLKISFLGFQYEWFTIKMLIDSNKEIGDRMYTDLFNKVSLKCEDWCCSSETFRRNVSGVCNIYSNNSCINSILIQLFFNTNFYSKISQALNAKNKDLIQDIQNIFIHMEFFQKEAINIQHFVNNYKKTLNIKRNDIEQILKSLLDELGSEYVESFSVNPDRIFVPLSIKYEPEFKSVFNDTIAFSNTIIFKLNRPRNVPFYFPLRLEFNENNVKYELKGVITQTIFDQKFQSIVKYKKNKWFDFENLTYLNDLGFYSIVTGGKQTKVNRFALLLFYEKVGNSKRQKFVLTDTEQKEIRNQNIQFAVFRYLFRPSTAEFILKSNDLKLILNYFFNFVCHSNFQDEIITSFASKIQNYDQTELYPFFMDCKIYIELFNIIKNCNNLCIQTNLIDVILAFCMKIEYNSALTLMSTFIENVGQLNDVPQIIPSFINLIKNYIDRFRTQISRVVKLHWLNSISVSIQQYGIDPSILSSLIDILNEVMADDENRNDAKSHWGDDDQIILNMRQKVNQLYIRELRPLTPNLTKLLHDNLKILIPYLVDSSQKVRDDSEELIYLLFPNIPKLEFYENAELLEQGKKWINVYFNTNKAIFTDEIASSLLKILLDNLHDENFQSSRRFSNYFRLIHWLKIRLGDESIANLIKIFPNLSPAKNNNKKSISLSHCIDFIELLHLYHTFSDEQYNEFFIINLEQFNNLLFSEPTCVVACFVMFISSLRTPEQLIRILDKEWFQDIFQSLQESFHLYQPYCYLISKLCKLIGSKIDDQKLELINKFNLLLANNFHIVMNVPHLPDNSFCFMRILKALSHYFTSEITSKVIFNYFSHFDQNGIDNDSYEKFIESLPLNEISNQAAASIVDKYFIDKDKIMIYTENSSSVQEAFCSKFESSYKTFVNDLDLFQSYFYIFMKFALKSQSKDIQKHRIVFFINSVVKLSTNLIITFLNSFQGRNCIRIILAILKMQGDLFNSTIDSLDALINCVIENAISMKPEIHEFLSIYFSKCDAQHINRYCQSFKNNLNDRGSKRFCYTVDLFKLVFSNNPNLIDEYPEEFGLLQDLSNDSEFVI